MVPLWVQKAAPWIHGSFSENTSTIRVQHWVVGQESHSCGGSTNLTQCIKNRRHEIGKDDRSCPGRIGEEVSSGKHIEYMHGNQNE